MVCLWRGKSHDEHMTGNEGILSKRGEFGSGDPECVICKQTGYVFCGGENLCFLITAGGEMSFFEKTGTNSFLSGGVKTICFITSIWVFIFESFVSYCKPFVL